jgi:hypothetical protein
MLVFLVYAYFIEKKCPAESVKYFSHCSCSYQCFYKIPKIDCDRICKNEPK